MKILSIRVKDTSTHISCLQGADEIKVRSEKQPSAAFLTALDDLRTDIAYLLDLPAEYCGNITVRGVTLSRKEGDNGESVKATIVAEKTVTHCGSPFHLATPLMALTLASEGGDVLPGSTRTHIERLCELAEEYVRNCRAIQNISAQTVLPFDGDGETGDTALPAELPLEDGDDDGLGDMEPGEGAGESIPFDDSDVEDGAAEGSAQ